MSKSPPNPIGDMLAAHFPAPAKPIAPPSAAQAARDMDAILEKIMLTRFGFAVTPTCDFSQILTPVNAGQVSMALMDMFVAGHLSATNNALEAMGCKLTPDDLAADRVQELDAQLGLCSKCGQPIPDGEDLIDVCGACWTKAAARK